MSLFQGASIGQKLVLETSSYSGSLAKAKADARAFGKDTETAVAGAHKAFVALGAAATGLAVGGIAALGEAVKIGAGRIDELQKVNAQTRAGLKSTGDVAKVTRGHIVGLASAIEAKTGIDRVATQTGQNMLLTFTNIRNEVGKGNQIFDQATTAVDNLAVKMAGGAIPNGQQFSKTAILIGKALNDPIKGMTALQRVGVTLDATQKKQITTLIKHGQTLKAQKIILAELNKEFGGAANALGGTDAAKLAIAKDEFADIAAKIDEALLPAFTKALTVVDKWIVKLEAWTKTKSGQKDLKELGDAAIQAGHALETAGKDAVKVAGFLNHHRTAVKNVTIAVIGFVAAWKTFQVVHTAVGIVNDMSIRTKLFTTALKGGETATKGLSEAQKGAATAGKGLNTVFTGLKSGAQAAISGAKSLATALLSSAKAAIAAGLSTARAVVTWTAARVAQLAQAAATGIATAAQWAFNAALDAGAAAMVIIESPILLVVAAVAAFAAGLYLAYKHVKVFHDAVDAAFGWIKAHWPLLTAILLGPIGIAVYGIIKYWSAIKSGASAVWSTIKSGVSDAASWVTTKFTAVVGFFKGMPAKISSAASGMWDGIKDAFKGAINWIITAWNNLEFTVPSVNTHIPGVGKVGGFSIGTPNIPTLATGGMVPGTGDGDKVPALLEPGEGVLNRNAVSALGGDGFLNWANTTFSRFKAGTKKAVKAKTKASTTSPSKVANALATPTSSSLDTPAAITAMIRNEVARQGGDPRGKIADALIATARNESGLNPRSVGDHGTSFGLFQFHKGGALGAHTAAWAFSPMNEIRDRVSMFLRGRVTTGAGAARIQRPADPAQYARNVDALLKSSKEMGIGGVSAKNDPTHAAYVKFKDAQDQAEAKAVQAYDKAGKTAAAKAKLNTFYKRDYAAYQAFVKKNGQNMSAADKTAIAKHMATLSGHLPAAAKPVLAIDQFNDLTRSYADREAAINKAIALATNDDDKAKGEQALANLYQDEVNRYQQFEDTHALGPDDQATVDDAITQAANTLEQMASQGVQPSTPDAGSTSGDTTAPDSSGPTVAELLAQLNHVAQTLNDAFSGENGNVFGGVTLAGDLHQHFQQAPQADSWLEATKFRLATGAA